MLAKTNHSSAKVTPMKTDMMTIRQMCDAFDVTPRTLRFYEAKELLFPERQGQKRLFTKRDRARLKLIIRGKRFGFSLEEIRQLLDLYHMGDQQETQFSHTYEIAQRRLSDMESQREELDQAIDDLKEQLKWGEKMIASLNHSRNNAA
jgi:DNA-binding transcriptional MerR regulator